MVVVDSDPYKFNRRVLEGHETHCITCDIVIMSKDWQSHSNGKKHRANKERLGAEASPAADAGGAGGTATDVGVIWDTQKTSAGVVNEPYAKTDDRTCNKCGKVGHIAKECSADVECRRCHEMGHFAKDCPKSSAFACHNCGSPDHKAKDCPEPRIPTCHNCDQKGHIAKECPGPRVPKCKNCDERGHLAKECPKPKDWSRIQCNNCQQMGHGVKRCPNPAVEASADGGWGATSGDASTGGWDTGNSKEASWDTGASMESNWDKTPTGADAFGVSTSGGGFEAAAAGGSETWDAPDNNKAVGGDDWANAPTDPNSGW